MVGIMMMTITTAHAMIRAMAGDMAAVSRGIVATACLPETTTEKVLVVLRGRLTVPTARRQTAVVRDSANNAAPR